MRNFHLLVRKGALFCHHQYRWHRAATPGRGCMTDTDDDDDDVADVDWVDARLDLLQFIESCVHDDPKLTIFLQEKVAALTLGESCIIEVSTETAKAHSCSHGAYDNIRDAQYVEASLRRDGIMRYTLKYTLAGTTIRFIGPDIIQDELFNHFAMGYFREPAGASMNCTALHCLAIPATACTNTPPHRPLCRSR